jgi:hypothetical protein
MGTRFKALVLSMMFSLRAGASDVDRPVLYAVYGADIMVRLARIHGHPDRDNQNSNLVVRLSGSTPGFVECRFSDNGATLLCEAVAGAYPPKPDAGARVMEDTIEEGLKKAGYYRDSQGRAVFAYKITPDTGVWGGASVVILTPLIDVFGARAGSKIDIIAPLAPQRDEAAIERELSR